MLVIIGAILLSGATSGVVHRTDEYLQAATLLVSGDQLRVDLRLAPGLAVVPTVLDSIDTNRDGRVSQAEGQEYGRKVLGDLSLTLDGERLLLRLVSSQYGSMDEMNRGLGEIELRLVADLPGGGTHRRIVFENRHRSTIAAYLMNSLVPEEPGINIIDQRRDYLQSVYELTYEQTLAGAASVSFGTLGWWSLLLGAVTILLVDRLAWLRRRRLVSPG